LRLLAAAVVATAALIAPTAGAATGTSFTFGRGGGNILPYSASIAANGRVTVDGLYRRTLSRAKMRLLVATVRVQRFFGLPRKIACARTLPDVATLYVTVRSGSRTRTVTEHGGCNKRFNRVYAALQTAAGGGE
jgi:hypothetical protein